MISNQLKLHNQIQLMQVLEEFVLKNIKYPLGDQTKQIEYFKLLSVDLRPNRLEYRYEITESDKQDIYALHAIGKFKETEQQKIHRATVIRKVHHSDDPNDAVKIPLIDRLPRYYNDILTDIKQFFSYIQSQETINLNQVEKLRKKAFHTYALHNDCQNLETVPKEIYKIFEKIHNGHQQQVTTSIIKKSFLQYAEQTLLDKNEVAKIRLINKDTIIEGLETASIPFVKEALIQQLKKNIELLDLQLTRRNHTKDCLLVPADPELKIGEIYIFSKNDRKYFDVSRRKLKKRISHYRRKADELEGIRENTTIDILRKKYTGDSETWLKQHKVEGQSLYQLIKEIVQKNKKHPHLKDKNS